MIIRNAQVFLEDRFQQVEVRIHNGRIHEIGASLAAGLYEEVLDLQGDYVLPGFVDVHIHAFHGQDVMQGGRCRPRHEPQAFQRRCSSLLPHNHECFCPGYPAGDPWHQSCA